MLKRLFVLFATALLALSAGATKTVISVPYLDQKDYASSMDESACAPTSLAMLLRYFYPNASVDMPEIYHGGTQAYAYTGPAATYTNISNESGTRLIGNWPLSTATQRSYYSSANPYTGADSNNISTYLRETWKIDTSTVFENGVYDSIRLGQPLLGHVFGHGNALWGHYVVIIGIDDKNTPNDRGDDTIYVHDPYNTHWGISGDTSGNIKAISYSDFFVRTSYGSAWFRDALKLDPQLTAEQRTNSVVVTTGNNRTSGNASQNLFNVDDESKFNFYYGAGRDWYYPTSSGHAARWTPRLVNAGKYDVSVGFLADSSSGSVTYTVYDESGNVLVASKTINQNGSGWREVSLGTSVNLSNGAYVKAINIGINTNVDTVRFTYVPGASSGTGNSDSEIASLVGATHVGSWVYYQSNTSSQWYISHRSGLTYLLSGSRGYSGGELVWGAIAEHSSVATIDFVNKSVAVASSATSLTPTNLYSAFALSDGRTLQVPGLFAYDLSKEIAGKFMPHKWYFFEVASTKTWYIVPSDPSDMRVLRLKLKADFSDYDWVTIPTNNWRKTLTPNSASGLLINFSK